MTDLAPEGRWFLGVRFMRIGLDQAVARIAARDPLAPFAYVSTANAQHVVNVARRNPRYAVAHDNAWLLTNDSQVLRLAARALFGENLPLAAGSDITAALFATTIDRAERVTVIGGSAELERRLRADLGLTRLSLLDPPMGFYNRPDEMQAAVDFVVSHPARFIFICVGPPQSELFAHAVQEDGRATGIGLCVGGSLNFLTNITPRAPRVFRTAGLEWLYRLVQEPRRRARRVLTENLPLIPLLLRARLSARPDHRRAPF